MPRALADAGASARVLPADGLLDVVRAVVGAGGSLWVRVTGVSMNPMLRDGDSVLLARLARPARRGDVLFVDVGGRPVLHRVRRIDSGLIVTRGDAALTDDPAVPPAACVAHALAVRRGPVTVALSPTFRFGAMPLLWLAAWTIRVRVPRSLDRGVKPLSRAIARALS